VTASVTRPSTIPNISFATWLFDNFILDNSMNIPVGEPEPEPEEPAPYGVTDAFLSSSDNSMGVQCSVGVGAVIVGVGAAVLATNDELAGERTYSA